MPVRAGAPVPPGKLRSLITYLEMTAPPSAAPPPPPDPRLRIERLDPVPVNLYRRLYRAVGEPWLWWERLVWSDDELAEQLAAPGIEVHVLWSGDRPAGYSELDRRTSADVEIVYFGLVPEAIGQGLGRWLLAETLRAAWTPEARRVWLHTCTEDHPRALAFYRSAGFRPYKTETTLIDDPRETGLLPVDAAPYVPKAVEG